MESISLVIGYFLGILTAILMLLLGLMTNVSGPECERDSGTTCSIQWVPNHE